MSDRSSEIETISIIVPVASTSEPWKKCLKELSRIEDGRIQEILFVSPESEPEEWTQFRSTEQCRWLVADKGRALQMNAAAQKTNGHFLWFVHVDSQFEDPVCLPQNCDARAIYYGDLKFGDEMPIMKVNEVGVWWRSHLLKMPFGDQTLLLSKKFFEELGGFDITARFGEDNLLIWEARVRGGKILAMPLTVITSPRKYEERGWWSMTSRHLRLTYQQAAPQLGRLLASRFRGKDE